jgi:hypothetical protein
MIGGGVGCVHVLCRLCVRPWVGHVCPFERVADVDVQDLLAPPPLPAAVSAPAVGPSENPKYSTELERLELLRMRALAELMQQVPLPARLTAGPPARSRSR